jgi:protein SCO1/2
MTPADTNEEQRVPMRTAIWVVLAAAAVVLILLRLVLSGAQSLAPLPVISQLPAFELTDQSNSAFGSEQLRGRPWIASFVYSTCPGPCPMVVQRLGDIKQRLSNDPRMTIVSITVDPDGDTPAVLEAYGRAHAIDPERWRLLTGDYNYVLDLVKTSFYLPIAENEGADPRLIEEMGPISHSTKFVLVDAEMQLRGYYDSNSATELKQLTAAMKRLLRSG